VVERLRSVGSSLGKRGLIELPGWPECRSESLRLIRRKSGRLERSVWPFAG
jgi:hypothetical protein